MVSRPSSVSLPRIGFGQTTRVLRIRAERELLDYVREQDGALWITVPSRESVAVGDDIQVEFSFGALADEIPIRGRVEEITPRAGEHAPMISIRVDATEALRVRYVVDVVRGQRLASARKHRRFPCDLPASWRLGESQHRSRLEDISRGGAFVRGQPRPPVGAEIELALEESGRATIRLRSTVAWVCEAPSRAGFGVTFRFSSRDEAAAVDDFVRRGIGSGAVGVAAP